MSGVIGWLDRWEDGWLGDEWVQRGMGQWEQQTDGGRIEGWRVHNKYPLWYRQSGVWGEATLRKAAVAGNGGLG